MQRTGLLIIDVQNAILDGLGGSRAAETAAALDGVVERIRTLLERARREAVPVFYVQHEDPPGQGLEPHTPGWQIRPEIAPRAGEPVIRKRACDSFFQTNLESELNSRNIQTLIVAGCMTEFCVDTTVRRAVSLGYDVVLAADGHMTAGSNGLTFEQIIAHHNGLLNGFAAGHRKAAVSPAGSIRFS